VERCGATGALALARETIPAWRDVASSDALNATMASASVRMRHTDLRAVLPAVHIGWIANDGSMHRACGHARLTCAPDPDPLQPRLGLSHMASLAKVYNSGFNSCTHNQTAKIYCSTCGSAAKPARFSSTTHQMLS
jgi:hypothetical protein